MCLIAIAYQAHPAWPLVVAANRDEFHARPALPANWWADAPQVWGGRDQTAGGSWMAVSRERRFAAVTNVRRMQPVDPEAPSRGGLIQDFMTSSDSASAYAERLADRAARYAGFNLLLYDGDQLYYASNHDAYSQAPVPPGVHCVSNASLDTPWPKAQRLRAAMQGWLAAPDPDGQALFVALADRATAPDEQLPETGVGLEMERFLSPPFICSPRYGTRASTVLTLAASGGLRICERRFDAAGEVAGESAVAFAV